MSIDAVILSTNEHPYYVDFWPTVARAYKALMPEVEVCLAYLGEHRNIPQSFLDAGNVVQVPPVFDVPQFAQAKMARFFIASQLEDKVCYIDDIDLIPLDRNFITDKTDKRPKDHLLCVGGEVYHNGGTYPISQMTAEGYLWKKFINPSGLCWEDLIHQWAQMPEMFDQHENMMQVNRFDLDKYFSDERFLRKLIAMNPVDKFELPRGYGNILDATLDRMEWKLDEDKLKAGGYVNAHCSRPHDPRETKPLIDYLESL